MTEHAVQSGRRRYRLQGSAAQRWFTSRGYVAALPGGAGADDLTVVADELVAARHVLRRVWHTAAQVTATLPPPRAHRALHVLLHVDGDATVQAGADTVSLSPQDVVVYIDDRRIALHAPAATARIEVIVPRPPETVSHGVHVFSAAPSVVAPALLGSTVNTVLNGEGPLTDRVSDALSTVVDATIAMLLAERTPPAETTRSPDRIYADALAFIADWGHIPTVTSASVHEAMHVSRQYLARVFAEHGTSAGAELRRHRARLARRLLTDGFMDATETAAAAGFPSVRTMRHVLREEG